MPEAPHAETNADLHDGRSPDDPARWLQVVETIPQIVWTATADGVVDYTNLRWHDFTGIPRDPSPDGVWNDLIHPDDRGMAIRAWHRSVAHGVPYESEYRLRHKAGGDYRWVLDRGEPIRNIRGQVVRWSGTCTDVHEAKLLEERLRTSEERFRTLVETSPLFLWSGDADGRSTYFNENWLAYTGLTLDEALDSSLWVARIHPEDRDRLAREARLAIDQGRDFEVSYRVRGSDGAYRWFLTRGRAVRDSDGAIVKWNGVALDIHDLKESELASIESEKQVRILADSMPQMMWLTDERGTLRYVNSRWTETVGLDITQPGTPNALLETIHPDDRPVLIGSWQESLETGHVFEAECRCWSQLTQEYRWQLSRAVPIRDGNDRIVRWLGTTTDIDQQKRISRLLNTETRVLEAMLDDRELPELLNLILLNFEEQFEDAIGMILRCEGDRLYPTSGPSLPPVLSEALRAGVLIAEGSGACGTAAHRRDLVVVVDARTDPLVADYLDLLLPLGLVACWSTPILLKEGEIYGTFAIYHRRPRQPSARDIELIELAAHLVRIGIERKRARDELSRKAAELALRDQRRSEFLAMLSHELRNPLGSLCVAAELARDSQSSHERAWAHDIIDRQVRLLTRLIDDLLDLSRIDRGKIRICRQAVEIHEVVDQAVEATRNQFLERNHLLTIDLAPELPPVQADPARLVQVLVNLLMNAAKYTDPGGQVVLTAIHDRDCVAISVADNGIGISPEKLGQVFEIFTQLEGSIDRTKGGLGIGLALVKALVELHGGSVEARSDGQGRGSRFTVRLPALTVDAPAIAPEPPSRDDLFALSPADFLGGVSSSADSGPLRRVLIVEDHEDARTAYARLLRQAGHEVRVARDGLEGLILARRFRPDVLLIDIGLPRLDGRALLRTLRQHDGLMAPAIAMSGYGEAQDIRNSLEAGFLKHLVKPVPPNTLIGLIRQLDEVAPESSG